MTVCESGQWLAPDGDSALRRSVGALIGGLRSWWSLNTFDGRVCPAMRVPVLW